MKEIQKHLIDVLENHVSEPFSSRQVLEIINERMRNGSTIGSVAFHLKRLGYVPAGKSPHTRNAAVWVRQEGI